ncbi:MAG: hypothetical protein DRQ55_07015 [Planctomycetota bacterium]|nr:MAG: hypothetical protein DRQ55_07015 [Planctomycetota bacterium]
MMSLLSAATLTLALCSPALDITEEYQRLFAVGDEAGMAQLWLANPGAILVTIDADLEAGLATWEQSPANPDAEAVAALHDRALWAAEVASRATGHPIFADYASAFVGFTTDQKRDFRAGQQAFGKARAAAGARDLEAALAAARECRDLALPLGDWWGGAMGLAMEGQMLLQLDRAAEAITPLEQARLIYADLGLSGSEYGVLVALADALATLERWPRTRVAADHAVALARSLGDADGLARLLARRREAERALGLDDAAQATADELAALPGADG